MSIVSVGRNLTTKVTNNDVWSASCNSASFYLRGRRVPSDSRSSSTTFLSLLLLCSDEMQVIKKGWFV